MDKKKYSKLLLMAALIAMAVVIFIALMFSSTLLWNNKKADLTSSQRYGLSQSTKKIIKDIKQPINVSIYMSKDLDSNYPELGLHAQNLLRMLEKMQVLSNGKISINLKNPEPYSPTEYEAKGADIRAFPDAQNTHNMYFGAVFSSGEGQRYVIPYFSVQRQNYLEYDVDRILAKLNKTDKKNVGVISFGGNITDWQIFKKIEQDYRVMFLNNEIPFIPQNINTLIVYNPQFVSNNFKFALDQYIMRGGNLILFIDPYAEVVAEKYPYIKKNKNMLLPLLKNWGISMDEQKIVADEQLSRTEYQTALSREVNPTYINLSSKNMNIPTFIGEGWPLISFRSAGNLKVEPQEKTLPQAIFFTSPQGKLIDANVVKYLNIDDMNNALPKAAQQYNMSYWISGTFKSFFEESIWNDINLKKELPPFLSSSIKPAQILIVADSDFIADDVWNLSGYQKEAVVYDQIPSNNNADFILSAIDFMNGNKELSEIRVKYLINQDKNIAEQIYEQTFQQHEEEYKEKEQEVLQLRKDLADFQEKLKSKDVGMSLLKIQELDDFNRKQQKIVEDIKALNYKIQQKSGQVLNKIIFMNILFIPFIIILMTYILVKIYIYRKKQKNIRIINE